MLNYEAGKVYLDGDGWRGYNRFEVLFILKDLPEKISFTNELAVIRLQNGDVILRKTSHKHDLKLPNSCMNCLIPNQYHICYNCKNRKPYTD